MQQMVQLSETNRQRESGNSVREKSKREQHRNIFSFDEDGHVTVKMTCGMHQGQKREKDEAREKGSGNVSKRRVLTVSGLATTACVLRELAGSKVMVEEIILHRLVKFFKREREKWKMENGKFEMENSQLKTKFN